MALRRRIFLFLALGLLALSIAPAALAGGGNYVFEGGTHAERQQVVRALDASSFNWSLVPQQITIHIAPGLDSDATVGNIWLDANLLNSGTFAWGVVQHEYAHQVDFFLLNNENRALLETRLHAKAWCWDDASGLQHSDYGCERFASTLAWTYWQSPANCMRPQSPDDESSALPPNVFRTLLVQLLGPRTQRELARRR